MKKKKENLSTKEEILKISKHLFALNGFEGTSIRDISVKAKVNVAAIHYHFQSKENLYHQIIRNSYIEISEEIKKLKNKSNSLSEFLLSIFRMYITHSDDYLTTMKLILSQQHSHEITVANTEDEMIGPPGGKSVYDAIKQEIKNSKCGAADYHWAVKSLFSYLIQMTMVYTCCYKNSDNHYMNYSSKKDLEDGLLRLTQVIIKELKSKK